MKHLLFLGVLAAAAWLQFEVFPGHSYLHGDTQVLAPALEHLQHPGLLSRDLVATHPALTYTLYDEITLFLQRIPHVNLELALQIQQLFFRFAALVGLFLLSRQAKAPRLYALILSVVVCCGGYAFGPAIPLIDREPQPAAFAVGAVLLSAGLFASSHPLLAGLFGGIAVIYDPRMAAPLWILVLLGAFFSRTSRRMFRASLPVLAVFALLLANASQLQPAIPEARDFFERLPAAIQPILRFRMPQLWIANWGTAPILYYFLLLAAAIAATRMLSRSLGEPARWMLIGLPVSGIAGMLASAILLDGIGWAVIPEWNPAHLVIYTALLAALACGLAALASRKAWAFLLLPALLPFTNRWEPRGVNASALSAWAAENTWGGSMFLFPDAGRSMYPGAFRAQSLRPVWVDWQTGELAAHFNSFADEWYRRWQDTMAEPYSPAQLRRFADLPIDYFVLRRAHALVGLTPVYADPNFVVYDAHNFRRGG